MTYYLVSGDTGAKLKATITSEDTGLPIDLGSKTTVLNVRRKGESVIQFSITGIDSSPADGETIFSFESYIVGLEAGFYEAEIEVTNADTTINSVYEIFTIKIREDF